MKWNWNKVKLGMFVGICALGSATTVASAYDVSHNDTKSTSQTQITLDQAIATAKKQVPGTVNGAKLENEQGQLIYEVKINWDGQTYDVKIDAKNGKVLSSQIYKIDQGDGDGEVEDDNGGADGEQEDD